MCCTCKWKTGVDNVTNLMLLLLEFFSSQTVILGEGEMFFITCFFFVFQSLCESSPCLNGGTCMANYNDNSFECLCETSCFGKYCEKGWSSCLDITMFIFRFCFWGLSFRLIQDTSIYKSVRIVLVLNLFCAMFAIKHNVKLLFVTTAVSSSSSINQLSLHPKNVQKGTQQKFESGLCLPR